MASRTREINEPLPLLPLPRTPNPPGIYCRLDGDGDWVGDTVVGGIGMSDHRVPSERNHCTQKQRHKDAAYALMACMIVHQTQGWNLFPYKCRYCEFYHIGHTNGAVRCFIQGFIGIRIEEKSLVRLTHSLGEAFQRANIVRLIKKRGPAITQP